MASRSRSDWQSGSDWHGSVHQSDHRSGSRSNDPTIRKMKKLYTAIVTLNAKKFILKCKL